VYHVDFLHRRYADDTDELIRNWGRFQSIAGPGTMSSLPKPNVC
jgi:hypothetical protein